MVRRMEKDDERDLIMNHTRPHLAACCPVRFGLSCVQQSCRSHQPTRRLMVDSITGCPQKGVNSLF